MVRIDIKAGIIAEQLLKCLILSFSIDVIDEGSGFCNIVSRDFSPFSRYVVISHVLVYNKFGGGKRGGGGHARRILLCMHVKFCMCAHAYMYVCNIISVYLNLDVEIDLLLASVMMDIVPLSYISLHRLGFYTKI